MLQEALNGPLLPGVEIRNNSEYLIEIGVTRKLSLVFETVESSEKANHAVSFFEDSTDSNTKERFHLTPNHSVSSTPGGKGCAYVSNLEAILVKLLNITILEAEYFYRKSIHSQIVLGFNSNETTLAAPYSRLNLDNHFIVNNLSWRRFIELGCYNKGYYYYYYYY